MLGCGQLCVGTCAEQSVAVFDTEPDVPLRRLTAAFQWNIFLLPPPFAVLCGPTERHSHSAFLGLAS